MKDIPYKQRLSQEEVRQSIDWIEFDFQVHVGQHDGLGLWGPPYRVVPAPGARSLQEARELVKPQLQSPEDIFYVEALRLLKLEDDSLVATEWYYSGRRPPCQTTTKGGQYHTKPLPERVKSGLVEAKNLDDFLDTYYKHDRYKGRGADYAAAIRQSAQGYIDKHGYTMISHHDNVTGDMVYWAPPG